MTAWPMRLAMPPRSLFVLLTLATCGAAQAVDVQEYQRARDDKVMQVYVAGLGSGYFWANAYLRTIKDAKPLYCQNSSLSLNSANYINILETRLRQLEQRGRKEANSPIEVVLLDALQQTFPCK